jgi:pimeloyl-ACP methyl ester carboxylesterase
MTRAELTRAEVNGYSVAYQDTGEGPPLVLLHGFLCDSRCWRRQLEDLSDSFRVVAWDAPGAGSSSDPPDPFTITDWAHCLAQFLDVIGIERAQVLGLSWGGVPRRSSIAFTRGASLGSYWPIRMPAGRGRFLKRHAISASRDVFLSLGYLLMSS